MVVADLVALLAFGPLLALLVVAEWVYLDAAARGSRVPTLWAVGSVFGGPVGLYYLFSYRRRHERERSPTPAERWFRVLALASVSSLLTAAVFAPPDPVSLGGYTLGGLVVFTPVLLLGRRRYERRRSDTT